MSHNKHNQHRQTLPPQHQSRQPGREHEMEPPPEYERADHFSAKRLIDKVAIITGGDSGIGRAVAVAFAKEGAHVALLYKEEHEDAQVTCQRVEELGRQCIALAGDLGHEKTCEDLIKKVMQKFDRIDVLVNNCAEQHPLESIEDISEQQLERTFRTNTYSYIFMIKHTLKYMKKNASIINCASVTAYRGSDHLIDYSSTKGSIVTLTRSLSQSLVERGIRVNAVAPGPVWTPLIPASFSAEEVKTFGSSVPMKRPGQPCEIAPSFVFLASEDASYMTGQVLHPNGGEMVGS